MNSRSPTRSADSGRPTDYRGLTEAACYGARRGGEPLHRIKTLGERALRRAKNGDEPMKSRKQAMDTTDVRGRVRAWRGATALVSAILIVTVGVGCGGGGSRSASSTSVGSRNVTAYCSYFYGEGTALRERMIRSSARDADNPITGLAGVFADMPEAASFMHGLAQRAPEEIAPQIEVLAKALEGAVGQIGSAASNPAGSVGSLIASSLESSGAEQRINEFTLQHCGPPPGSQPAKKLPTGATVAASGALELLACEESPSSNGSSVVALRYEAGAITSSPVASFAKAEKAGCPVSANLSYMAATERNSAGNVVAGYVPNGGGAFVDVAGAEKRGFSDEAVTDQQPRFNWTTGELWWLTNNQMWSASIVAKQPQLRDSSANVLNGFSATGSPEELVWQQSLEGNVVFMQPSGEEYNVTGNEYVVGTLVTGPGLDAACEKSYGGSIEPFAEVSGCKGVSSFDVSTQCLTIVGFVSTNKVVCKESGGSGTRFSLQTVAGSSKTPAKATPLIPETQQTIQWAQVTPDGKSLWFSASEKGGEGGVSTGETATAGAESEARHIYVVPTANYTASPTPATGHSELGTEASLIAWRQGEKMTSLHG